MLFRSGTSLKNEQESDSERHNEDNNVGVDESKLTRSLADFEELVKTTNIVQKDVEVKLGKRNVKIPEELINGEGAGERVDIKEVKDEAEECRVKLYDPSARNPKFCGAELTFAYELVVLSRHVHPSVALFARTLLGRQFIRYTGNPIDRKSVV